MESKIQGIQPVSPEPKVKPDQTDQRSRFIPPVANDKISAEKVDNRKRGSQKKTFAAELDPKKVAELVEKIQEYLEELNISLKFRVDDKTGQIVVQVLDGAGDLIRQIPPEELLKLREKMKELRGVLFDDTV